jgi:hypothetical protein
MYLSDLEIEDRYLERIRLEDLEDEEIGDPRQYIEKFYCPKDLKKALSDFDDTLEFMIEKENDSILSDQKYTLTVWEYDREWEKKDFDYFFSCEARSHYENTNANEWYS